MLNFLIPFIDEFHVASKADCIEVKDCFVTLLVKKIENLFL
jgi:hypothetical protein